MYDESEAMGIHNKEDLVKAEQRFQAGRQPTLLAYYFFFIQ